MASLCLLMGFLYVLGCSASDSGTPETDQTIAPPSSTIHSSISLSTEAATTAMATTLASEPPSTAAAPADTTTAPSTPPGTMVASVLPQTSQTATEELPSTTQMTTASSAPQGTLTPSTMQAIISTAGGVTDQPKLNVTSQHEQGTVAPSAPDSSATSATDKSTPANDEKTTATSLLSTSAETTTPSASPVEAKLLVQDPTEDPNDQGTLGLISTPSPHHHSVTVPLTTASGNIEPIMSTKQTSTTFASVPAATTQAPDDSRSGEKIGKSNKTVKVECVNESGANLVKMNLKASRICGNAVDLTIKEQSTLLAVCKAVMPGYQDGKDKCTIKLAHTSGDELPIISAVVETQPSPKDLYANLKKQDASSLFSFGDEPIEDIDRVSIPLISAIVSLAVALLIIAAIYGCWHQRQTRKREQRLTEELQTMENGYHDNPTLEVMETAPEMQEKKGGPNGELGDSWIVPLDNLAGDELLDEEEDTHL